MRMSCNGWRVLRKGCSNSCVIRPWLQWNPNSEAQANATVFLAKFYGRAGLINLIAVGPEHHRPAIFRSLLYEACGRILNPVYGSVPLLKSCDIRHVAKSHDIIAAELHIVSDKSRSKFKRAGASQNRSCLDFA